MTLFPTDNPFVDFLYWLINTPTLGGVIVGIAIGMLVAGYVGGTWWVLRGQPDAEQNTYAYPTPTLLHEHDPAKAVEPELVDPDTAGIPVSLRDRWRA